MYSIHCIQQIFIILSNIHENILFVRYWSVRNFRCYIINKMVQPQNIVVQFWTVVKPRACDVTFLICWSKSDVSSEEQWNHYDPAVWSPASRLTYLDRRLQDPSVKNISSCMSSPSSESFLLSLQENLRHIFIKKMSFS